MAIQIGDPVPEVMLQFFGEKGVQPLSTKSLFSGKKVVLFGIPGAFTPICSQTHAPSFLEYADDFYEKGIDQIACIAVNDAFVMDAWAEELGAGGEILFLADGNGDFTKAVGLEFDGSSFGLGMRSQRYAMLVEDGVVKILRQEASPGVCTISDAKSLLDALD